jgi:NADH:ubiquinone oxidoreductase subunit 5 (subunit L)/multisubunit Na+/H+ antiporter MnhA subunit
VTALAPPLLPLAAALLLLALHNRPRFLGPLAVLALVATLALGVWAAAEQPAISWQWSLLIRLQLSVEGFGRVMAVLVPLIAAPIVAYAASTEREGRPRLLAIMLAFTGAMLLLVSAADFLTLLIAWELVGACSWALIGHGWRDPANVRSASQAFITTRFGDLGLYLAAGLLFAETGSFAFAGLASVDGLTLDAIAAGVLLASAAKSAQVPFSPWLFAAMAGPTPVSALLHSATLVAAGAYLLIRLSPALEPAAWFLPAVAAIGLATALAGGVVATLQTHAKRVLAGSTSAQYGLMFIAIGASSTAAAGAHLVAHAAFKSLLFLGAGVAIHAANSPELAAMRLGRLVPFVAALSLVGVLALAAVPPIGGAWTKEQIVAAAGDSSTWLAVGALAAGFLSALYATRYHLLVWGRAAASDDGSETPRARYRLGMVEAGSIALLAAVTVFLSTLWLPGARGVVKEASGGELFEGAAWELAASIALIAAAVGLARLLLQRGRLLSLGLSPGLQTAAADWLAIPAAAKLLVVDPVLALARFLARFDNRVVDAGVRLAASFAGLLSHLFSLRAEWTIDGLVQAVARMTMLGAGGSRLADEAAIDGAVEGGARGVGVIGGLSRRLQTGQSHHYYVILAVGFVAIVAVLGMSL